MMHSGTHSHLGVLGRARLNHPVLLRFSWQWLFAINLPIALLLIAGAMKLLPAGGQHEPQPFDLKGMFTLIAAMGALILAINGIDTNAPLKSVLTPQVGGALLSLALLTAIFWRIENLD